MQEYYQHMHKRQEIKRKPGLEPFTDPARKWTWHISSAPGAHMGPLLFML